MEDEMGKVREQMSLAVQKACDNLQVTTCGAFMTDATDGILAIKVGNITLEELIERKLKERIFTVTITSSPSE